jgi:putative flippase GtrA
MTNDSGSGRDAREVEQAEVAAPGGMVGSRGPLLDLVKNDKIAFVIVGAANTAIGFFWFILFELTVGQVAGYMVSLILAHVAAVLCAFVLYRTLVFRVTGHVVRDLVRFELVYLSALAVNAVLLPISVEVVGIPPIPSQFLIVFVTAVMSYVGHKHFSFRRPPTQVGQIS